MTKNFTTALEKDSEKTALVVFSRDARDEMNNKALGSNQDLQLFETLIRQTRRLADESNLPLLWMGSEAQSGATFKDRILHAFESAFSKGFQSVVLIGSDCPSLKNSDLHSAQEALENGNVVLGPSKDGGVWLIGLNRAQFEQLSLEQLPWKNADLYAAFDAQLRTNKFDLTCLRRLTDIDKIGDLDSVLQELPNGSSIKESLLLLVQLTSPLAPFELTSPPILWTAPENALRGPPMGC